MIWIKYFKRKWEGYLNFYNEFQVQGILLNQYQNIGI